MYVYGLVDFPLFGGEMYPFEFLNKNNFADLCALLVTEVGAKRLEQRKEKWTATWLEMKQGEQGWDRLVEYHIFRQAWPGI